MDITAIGDINLDIVTSALEGFPERDSQVICDISLSSGGCAANFAKASSRLGLDVRFIGKVGGDIIGEYVRDSMQGVDLCLSAGEKTGITFAIAFEDCTRSFITYPGSNGEFTIEDVDFNLIDGEYMHVASFFLQGLRENTEKILDYAHGKGMKTSFDTGCDPGGWTEKDRKLVRKILRDVDIFFPNLKEGRAITGAEKKEDVCEELLAMGPEIIALKLGSKGSYITSGEDKIVIPPVRVETMDTTGAGDVFDAAFVYGHSKGWDLKKNGRFANAAAALSTQGYGSERYPGLGDVSRLV